MLRSVESGVEVPVVSVVVEAMGELRAKREGSR
jgi:hypothetical protein